MGGEREDLRPVTGETLRTHLDLAALVIQRFPYATRHLIDGHEARLLSRRCHAMRDDRVEARPVKDRTRSHEAHEVEDHQRHDEHNRHEHRKLDRHLSRLVGRRRRVLHVSLPHAAPPSPERSMVSGIEMSVPGIVTSATVSSPSVNSSSPHAPIACT